MKKYLLFSLCCLFLSPAAHAAGERFVSCGPGFVLADKGKVDGISTAECQKLWCRDLENGKNMGAGDKPSAGYKATTSPSLGVTGVDGTRVECFGDRKWCNGEQVGLWNQEFGAYTKGGADNNSYLSALKGDCFAWQVQKPHCTAADETAVLQGGQWVCAVSGAASGSGRPSAVRRTGAIRR